MSDFIVFSLFALVNTGTNKETYCAFKVMTFPSSTCCCSSVMSCALAKLPSTWGDKGHIYIISKKLSSAPNLKSCDRSAMRRTHKTVAILAGVATRKHGQGSANIPSHPRKPRYRCYYLNREVLHWLQFSITGSIFCGFRAILKTWHLHVKRYDNN